MRSIITLAIVVVLAALSRGQDLPKILPPIVEDAEEVVVLLLPGAYINALKYQPLGEALQNASSLSLWVALVGPFTSDLPNPAECDAVIEESLTMMRDMGMQSDVLFLAGHSLGGVVMQSWGWDNVQNVSGFVLLGSELMTDGLADSPRPVMHLSGDLDGLETVAEYAPVFQELQEMSASDPQSKIRYPVVIVEELNHMLIASGDPTPAVQAKDILSSMTEEEAHSLIAAQMSAFLTAVSGFPPSHLENSVNLLMSDYDATYQIMKPLFDNYYLTDGGTSSEWSQIGQVIMSSIAAGYEQNLIVNDTIFESPEELEQSRPSIELIGDVAHIWTYTYITYPRKGFSEIVSASEMAVKFKSREAVMEVLEPDAIPFNGNTSCKQINEEGFLVVLNSTTDLQRERYFNRCKKIVFEEDDVKVTGLAWVENSIIYEETDANLFVTSVSLPTSLDAGFDLGGMHYCKLMPPARMIEYIMITGLRGTDP